MGVPERPSVGSAFLPEDHRVGRQGEGGVQVQRVSWGCKDMGTAQEQQEHDLWETQQGVEVRCLDICINFNWKYDV